MFLVSAVQTGLTFVRNVIPHSNVHCCILTLQEDYSRATFSGCFTRIHSSSQFLIMFSSWPKCIRISRLSHEPLLPRVGCFFPPLLFKHVVHLAVTDSIRIPNVLTNRMVLNLRAYESGILPPDLLDLDSSLGMDFAPNLWLGNIGFSMQIDQSYDEEAGDDPE